MKRKTIERVIRKKLTEWLASIKDDKLALDLRKNIVLSGGSITSMFLQEEVNDYDIYIMDITVCERLAKYYCHPLNIGVLNGNNKETYLKELPPDELYENDEYGENVSERAVRLKSLHPGQIKLDLNGAGKPIKYRKEDDKKNEKNLPDKYPYCPVFLSQNAISLSDNIQIVTRFTGTVEEIHESFDFIHATNYFTFDEGLVTNVKALESILTKELRYQGSKYPLTSIIRVKKFIARKWTCNAGEMLKMMFQVAELDLMNPIVLEEQLIGVDIAYFSQLIEILRNTDPKEINHGYLVNLIDKVFNQSEFDD